MRALLLGFLLLPFLVGCAAGKSKVSGRVLYNGKPLPGGSVFFRPADPKQNAVTAELDEQGNYEVTLPVGEVQVAVDNRALQPRPAGPSGVPPGLPPEVLAELSKGKKPTPPPEASNPNAPTKPSGKYVAIPENYYTVEKSGLKFTVESGEQKHDIELK